MSASREKKARQELNESGYVDPRKAREAEEKAKERRSTRIYTAVIVAFVLLGVVLFASGRIQASNEAKETARIYAFGDGGEMADMIAPGYVKKFEDSSKVLSVSDIQDIYINKFRAYTDEQVGDIDTIECKVTDIQAVSNIEDVQQQFADNGVKGVSQYRSVEADWIVTGKDGGEVTVHVQECMLKCDDGWYVDYVRMPDEIDSMSTPVDSGDADSEETTEAEITE